MKTFELLALSLKELRGPMSGVVLAMPSAARSTEYAGRLLAVIRQLEEIGDALAQDGMGEEAGSLATVIADLHWQSEELINKAISARNTAPPPAARRKTT